MPYLEIVLILDGNDYNCSVEYEITHYGSGGAAASLSYPGDPPEPPEFEINSITYNPDPENQEVELNYDKLAEAQQELIDQAIYESIEESSYDDYPEPDYD